jgi:tetratricopeptide (TPR) repeat protein
MTASRMSTSPADFDALLALALGQHRAGRLDEAAAAYQQMLLLWPDVPELHINLGVVLKNQGKLDEAAEQYRQALALGPNLADAHNNLGNILRQQGKLDQAAARFEQAIALRPDYAEAHNNLGVIFWHQNKLDEAVARYQQALALKPNFAEAHNNLGNAFMQQGQFDQALAQFEQAIALRPNYAEAHANLGNLLLALGKSDEAAARYLHALAVQPGYADAHYNLGSLRLNQGKLDEAAAHYQQALALLPDHAHALRNLAVALRDQRKLDEARQVFQRLEALQPDLPEGQLGQAGCHLIQGDYQRGWPAYESRLRMPGVLPQLNLPRWTGQSLTGRSLLLLAEQGLGDTLHFVRYARLLKLGGARIVLACPSALGRLLASQPDLDELFILGSAHELPPCDFYLPLLSAPAAFHTDAATIPAKIPYLAADPALTAHWRRELAELPGIKIGIAWQGARDYHADPWRSIPLAQFAPLARLPGVRLVSLQKGFGSEQIATVDFPVVDLSGRLDEAAGPFMDTAAVIAGLDLVVGPDTAIAHLAGALGAPIWIALQFSPNWRWLLDRDDSPWYPTARLFRQTTLGQWPDVFERIASAVEARRWAGGITAAPP